VTLLLDAGNSRVKWAVQRRGGLAAGTPIGYDGAGLEANLEAALGALDPPARVLLCSVLAAPLNRRLTRWLRNRWNAPVAVVVASRRGCGVVSAYPEPGRLGVDRWATLVAAHGDAAGGTTCIVDAGTAVTVDLLAGDGRHLGGLIVPGLVLARAALTERTGRIGPTGTGGSVPEPMLAPASDTDTAVRGGTLYQLVAFLDRMLDDAAVDAEGGVRGLLTGGDAELLGPLLRGRFDHRPHLVLEGLARIATARCNQRPAGD
jgi:type III pantothenate kinase